MSGWERPGWLVRIRRATDGAPAGAGVLGTDRHILTCAHVVDPAMAGSPSHVVVDFPFAEPHDPMAARVVTGGWFPAAADGTGDIAVLEVAGELPPAARPAPLRMSGGTAGHRFRATGFPAGHDGAVVSRGIVVGPAEAEWLQLQAESALGFSLEAGFSGAPLWDEDAGAVVGIVVGRERHRGEPGDPRTGYAIPVEVVERYWAALRPWVGWRLDHDPDLRAHWAPRARGAGRDSLPGWHFTGRTAAINRLVRWLGEPADDSLHVVTGGPGSGKSAVLARLVTTADPLTRTRIAAEAPEQLADPATVPPPGSISLAIRCTGLDLSRVSQALSRFHHPTDDPETVVAELARQDEPLVVVVDALDEAVSESEARAIAVRLLRPLAEAFAPAGSKVLVATRRGHNDSLLRALGPAVRTDLDEPEFFDPADLTAYAERLLLDGSYGQLPRAAHDVAEAIARRGRPSFLIVGLTARARAGRPPADLGADEQEFPADVDDAMREYLQRLADPDRALALLRILANGRRSGLTLDLWEAAAAAYLPAVSRAEIDGLLRAAAAYLVEQRTADGEPAVQLFHQALADHLRAMDSSGLVDRTIADVLVRDAAARGGWLHAGEYARHYAVSHAAAAGGRLLEELVTDPEFLVVAERGAVLRALRAGRGRRLAAVGAVYRAAAHALTGSAAVNASHLELAARRAGDDDLADRVRSLPLGRPFGTRAVAPSARPADQMTLVGQTAGIAALTWGVVDGRPTLVSGDRDGTVNFWDPADGALLDSFDGDGGVSSLGWVELDGTRRLAAARANAVTLWDLARPRDLPRVVPLTRPDTDRPAVPEWEGSIDTVPAALDGSSWHQDRIATGWGRLDGAPVLMHGYDDGSARIWRVEDGVLLHSLRAHLWGLAAEWGELDGRPTMITIGNDEVVTDGADEPLTRQARWFLHEDGTYTGHGRSATVRFWDLDRRAAGTEYVLADLLASACALTVSDGRALLAVAADDERVHVLDTDGGEVATFPGQAPLAWGAVHGVPVLAFAGDGVVRVWDSRTPEGLHTITSNDTVSALVWGALDGRPLLAGGGESGRIQLWQPPDLAADLPADPPSPVRALSWSGSSSGGRLAAGSGDGQVTIVDPAAPGPAVTFAAHDDAVGRVAWGEPDGRPVLATATYEGDVAIWDPATRRRLLALPRLEEYLRLLSWVRLDGQELLAVASQSADLRLWGVDGHQVAPGLTRVGRPVRMLFNVMGGDDAAVVCGVAGEIRVYDPATWEVAYSFHEGMQPADRAPETCVATTFVDGSPVTARGGADGRLTFWYPREGFADMFDPVDAHDGPVLCVAWGKSEATRTVLASGGADGRVMVWDTTDPAEPSVWAYIDSDGPVNALAWTWIGDEDVLVVGTATGNVYLLADLERTVGGVEDLTDAVTALATAPDYVEHVTAIGTAGQVLLLLFQLENGEQAVYELSVPAAVSALAWSYWPDEWPVLAVGLADGGVVLWNPRRVVGADRVWRYDDPAAIQVVAPPTGVPVTALCWGPEGPPTLIVGAADGMLRTWDVTAGAETHAFSTDLFADTVLATGRLNDRAVLATTGSMLRVWDIATGDPVVVSDVHGRSNDQLLFTELDGRPVMIQQAHDGIRVWDPQNATAPHVAAITGLTPPVLAFGTLNEQPVLAIGTPTGLITLANLRDGTQRTIDWYSPVHALAIGPDDQLAIGDPRGYTVLQVFGETVSDPG